MKNTRNCPVKWTQHDISTFLIISVPTYLFFLCSGRLSWPLSDSLSDEDEESDDEDEEDESEEESDAIPELLLVSILSAISAKSGLFSCDIKKGSYSNI